MQDGRGKTSVRSGYKRAVPEDHKVKIQLRAKKIGRAENQSIQNALWVMEQSLVEHKGYIVELQEDHIRQTMQYERTLADLWEDKKGWKAQCLARQLYIKHTIKQIYKAIRKAHEILEKVEALHQSFFPTKRNGQELLNFIFAHRRSGHELTTTCPKTDRSRGKVPIWSINKLTPLAQSLAQIWIA